MTLCQLDKIDAWFIAAYQTLTSRYFECDYDHKAYSVYFFGYSIDLNFSSSYVTKSLMYVIKNCIGFILFLNIVGEITTCHACSAIF